MLYSASTGGFYDEASADAPADALKITDAVYNRMLKGNTEGKEIVPDENGKPTLVDPAPPSDDFLLSAALGKRDALLTSAGVRVAPLQDAADLGIASDAETALLKKLKEYRVSLMRIHEQAEYPSNIQWPTAPEVLG